MLCTTTVQEVQSSSYHPHMSFLRRTRYQAGDEPIWREVADWTFQNKNALSALPHVKRSGYFSMNEGGKREEGRGSTASTSAWTRSRALSGISYEKKFRRCTEKRSVWTSTLFAQPSGTEDSRRDSHWAKHLHGQRARAPTRNLQPPLPTRTRPESHRRNAISQDNRLGDVGS